MKVKKFKIRPRLGTVKRILKSLLGANQLPSDIDVAIPQESEFFVSKLHTSAFYQTWPHEEIPDVFKRVLSDAGLGKAISVSGMVATIGSDVEDEISKLLMSGENFRANTLTALGEEGADLAFHFLRKLLADEAKSDDCEIAEPIPIQESPLIYEALGHLNADAEGVTIDSAEHISPRFTRVALAAWTPVSRKKKSGSLARNDNTRDPFVVSKTSLVISLHQRKYE